MSRFRSSSAVAAAAAVLLFAPALEAQRPPPDPDPRATARAQEMVRERAQPEEIAREMQRVYRLDAAAAVAVLHHVRVPAAAVARATSDVYRASPPQVASHLAARGLSAEASARALQEGLRATPDILAVSLKDGLGLSRDGVESTMRGIGLSVEATRDALLRAGFLTATPGIQRFWIADYRPGASGGAIIQNDGILDRNSISTTPDATDGEVWIEGVNLDFPDTEVFAGVNGGTPEKGEILERTTVGSLQRLRVRFSRVPGTGLMVRHSGGEVVHEARRLSYQVVERELFEQALNGLTVILGDPEGSGLVRVGSQAFTLTLPPHHEAGLEVILTDVRNDGFSLATSAAPGGAALEVTIPFQEQGREFRGRAAAYVPCWVCATFEVPQAECGMLDVFCFAEHLGIAVSELLGCLNPANWKEEQILDLDGVPFEGDLSNASFLIRMEVVPNAQGRLRSQNTLYSFQANVSIVGPQGDISLSAIEGYLTGKVTESVASLMDDLDLAGDVAGGVNQLADALGWTRIRGIHALSQGRFFLDVVL